VNSLTLSAAALFAGVVSFLSPCVLPLVPGYLSMVSGVGAQELREGRAPRPALMWHGLVFVLGFSLVFISFGAIASSIGQVLARHMALLSQVAGIIIIVFGLHLTRLVPLRWLYANRQLDALFRNKGPWGAFLIGIAFGLGWTPCVGPVLAGILALAASEATLAKGIALLSLYSLGLAVPFLATSLAVDRFLSVYQRLRHHLSRVEFAAGTLMIAVGILVLTRHLTVVNAWLSDIPIFRSMAEHFL
jgi:cytochrome c-type biogenesis protein